MGIMSSGISPQIQEQVSKGITVLKKGGIIAYPTDTVYGLGASIDCPEAIERIYRVKERPKTMALPLLLASISQIHDVAVTVPDIAFRLARRFLPGALTLVLFKSSSVPDIVTAGGKTVAVRVPAHPVPIALIEGIKAPIVGTSANLSGKPSPLTAGEVCNQLGDRLDLIIDGGRCPGGVESTVVDVTQEPPVILRAGAISIEEIRKIAKNIYIKEGA